jgi:hypothetical protein
VGAAPSVGRGKLTTAVCCYIALVLSFHHFSYLLENTCKWVIDGAATGGKLLVPKMDEPRKQQFFTVYRFPFNIFVPLQLEIFEYFSG